MKHLVWSPPSSQEITAAAKLLEPLCNQGDISSPALRSSIGRIYLQGGIIHTATKHFSLVAADPTATEDMKQMNAALLASAEGQWTEASDNLKAILEKDSENYVVCCPILFLFLFLLLYHLHSADTNACLSNRLSTTCLFLC